MLRDIVPMQWAAGLVAATASAFMLAAGRPLIRFLIIWTALALAPFMLWDALYTSPRYVYLAAAPFAIVVAILARSVWDLVTRTMRRWWPGHVWPLGFLGAVTTAAVLTIAFLSAGALRDRNQDWGRATARYGQLAEELKRQVPSLPKGSRIFIVSGDTGDAWATAMARTIYGDKTLTVRFVSPFVADSISRRQGDFVFFFVGEDLIASQRTAASR
jgi:hypothetical protein